MPRERKYKNEADVKKHVKEILKANNIWFFMPQAGQFGNSGIPDFICCKHGAFIAIETKFGYNKPTALQETRIEEIQHAGGVTMVVNETNLELAEVWLRDL